MGFSCTHSRAPPPWLPRCSGRRSPGLNVSRAGSNEFLSSFSAVLARRFWRRTVRMPRGFTLRLGLPERPASQRRSPGGEGAECTAAQTAAVLPKEDGTATTSTADTPRRSWPRAVGFKRPGSCLGSSSDAGALPLNTSSKYPEHVIRRGCEPPINPRSSKFYPD